MKQGNNQKTIICQQELKFIREKKKKRKKKTSTHTNDLCAKKGILIQVFAFGKKKKCDWRS